jgi:lipoprotein-anchoring transpeptidase ErfK/SrfK
MPHRPSSPTPDRRRLASAAVGLLGVVGLVTACTSANGQGDPAGTSSAGTASDISSGTSNSAGGSSAAAPTTPKPTALTVVSVSPAAGATAVETNAAVVITLSTPLAPASAKPKITPAVAGRWTTGPTTLTFTPTAPWPAATRITVTVPAGLVSSENQKLTAASTASFVTKAVSAERVQQLLAELGYLPLSFHVTGRAHTGNETALAEAGSYSWKWSSAQSVLGAFWSTSRPTNRLTRAALMDFQRQHGLATDGVAGPRTAAALVQDALAHRSDPHTYNYVHVSKATHESLTLYVNGAVKSHVAVSTGITGATTYDGLFPVYAHMYYTRMRGTNVDGTKYDDDIYWASYFNGGEAMHAYPRASYGFPQSNGCVEIQPSNAKKIWPFTPVGTPVTVTG